MSRVQLALNVDDIDRAVDFYSKLFGVQPAKRRPGYANFAIDSPPLKLVLVEQPGAQAALNHLGVEVASTNEVTDQLTRLRDLDVVASEPATTTCCYAVQDKFWVTAPDGERWEHYTVLADASPGLESRTNQALSQVAGDGQCCTNDSAGSVTCC